MEKPEGKYKNGQKQRWKKNYAFYCLPYFKNLNSPDK